MSLLDPLSLSIQTNTPPYETRDGLPIVRPTRRLLTSVPGSADYTLELDYSSASIGMRCWRAAQNKLVWSREGRRSNAATDFGSCFHLCEEVRLLNGHNDLTFGRQREIVADWFVKHPVAVDEYRNAARMTETLTRYNSLYATDGWPTNVVDHEGAPFVERPYKIELCTIPVHCSVPFDPTTLVVDATTPSDNGEFHIDRIHILLTGRIDTIVRDSGLLWVVDHKTSSRGGREYEEAFYLSLQTRGYAWAAKRLGIPVSGMILNAVIGRRPTTTGTGIEFKRQSYFYTEDSLREYELSMRAYLEDFVHRLVSGYFPQLAQSFKSPCAGCDYQENCRLPLHQRHADLFSELYQPVTWNPMGEAE